MRKKSIYSLAFFLLLFLDICYSRLQLSSKTSTTESGISIDSQSVYYVLCFSTKIGQQNLTTVLNNLISPLQAMTYGPFYANFIVSVDTVSPTLSSINDVQNYFNNITIDKTGVKLNNVNNDDGEMWKRLNKTSQIIQYNLPHIAVSLLTDYYSNIKDNQIVLSELLTFHAVVYDYDAFKKFQGDKVISYFANFDNNHINPWATPFPFPVTPTTQKSKTAITKTTIPTPTTSITLTITTSTSSTTSITSTTAVNDLKKDGISSTTVIIISVSGIAIFIIITVFCNCIYRRQKTKRNNKNEEKCNENDDFHIDLWELTWDKLILDNKELGSGAYGQVLQGKLFQKPNYYITSEDCENPFPEKTIDVAVKILHKHADEDVKKNFFNEIQLMKLISGHDNIVNMIGCITLEKKICLVLEFCPFRDLLQYVKLQKENTSSENRSHILKEFLIFSWQISQGMNFLVSKGIIHKNLKAQNILIDESKNAKISGFGLCVYVDKCSKPLLITSLNLEKFSLKWLAIECLRNFEFSLQSDVWSFGMVLYEIFSFGVIPFCDIDATELLEYLEVGNRPQKPEYCSNEIYAIMTKCWNTDHTLRPTFNELITRFTVLLEHATEGYGYLALLKSDLKLDTSD